MRLVIVAAALGLASAGCTAIQETPPTVWKESVVERWRLTERAYGAMNDAWTDAGDGAIAPGAQALFFEPVFRPVHGPSQPPASGRYGPCRHQLRIRYEGELTHVVGTFAETILEVPGPPGAAHVLEVVGSHAGIEVGEVKGAFPLAGEPGRYVLGAGVRATFRFTSRFVGRGGLEVRLVGEVPEAARPGPEDAVVTGP